MLIQQSGNKAKRNGHAIGDEERIQKGFRNDSLFRLGCSMRRNGLIQKEIAAALEVRNRDRCEPPLSSAEVQRIAASAAHYDHTQSPTVANGDDTRIKLLTLRELESECSRPTAFFLKDYIIDPSLTLLVAFPGAGKTFLALSLCIGVATGQRAWGLDTIQGSVIYLDAENGPHVMFQRAKALLQSLGVHALPDNLYFGFNQTISLIDPHSVTKIGDKIKATGARLLVLDSFVRFFGGKDENNSVEISMAMKNLHLIKSMFHCNVLLLDHPVKSGKSPQTLLQCVRGSGDKTAAVDQVLVVVGSEGAGTLHVPKIRAACRPPGFSYKVEGAGDAAWISVGEPQDTKRRLVDTVSDELLRILRASSSGLTRKNLQAALKVKASERTISDAIKQFEDLQNVRIDRVQKPHIYQWVG